MSLGDKNVFCEGKYYFYNKWQTFQLKRFVLLANEKQRDIFSEEYLSLATTAANSAVTLGFRAVYDSRAAHTFTRHVIL
jgi:hypothetical protein